MSAAGHDRIRQLVAAVVPTMEAGIRFRALEGPGKGPLETHPARTFDIRAQTLPADAGVAAASIAEWTERWDLRVVYPASPTHDATRLGKQIAADMRAIQRALTEAGDWTSVLDNVDARGPARLEPVPGAGGGVAAVLAILTLTVSYQNPE